MPSAYNHLYACIHIPDFLVQTVVRSRSDISYTENPLAILDGAATLQKVVALNVHAQHAGIENGMTRARAEMLPDVKLLQRIVQQEHAADSALIDCGYSVSPLVESTCPGTIIIDVTGAQRLLGSAKEIGQKLAIQAGKCGFHAQIALSGNPDAALHAARGLSGVTVIPAGEEAAWMACLPIEVLQLEPEVATTMDNWGVHDLLSLSKLPTRSVVQRLGERGLQLQHLAGGKTERKLIASEPPTDFQESL